MTPRQKFMQLFLKEVFGFEDVSFEPAELGHMDIKGTYPVKVTVSYCPLMKNKVSKEWSYISIFFDKLKSGDYSIKFKTWEGHHISEDQFDEVLRRARQVWPSAKADIYYQAQYGTPIPTLRLQVSKLPWK